jgi:hypothetical protein
MPNPHPGLANLVDSYLDLTPNIVAKPVCFKCKKNIKIIENVLSSLNLDPSDLSLIVIPDPNSSGLAAMVWGTVRPHNLASDRYATPTPRSGKLAFVSCNYVRFASRFDTKYGCQTQNF